METILLLMWFVVRHEPMSDQVQLGSKEACEPAQTLFVEDKVPV